MQPISGSQFDPSDELTPRELDILDLIAAGLSNNEIASDLYLSINTVKTYVRSAYRKLGVNTRSEAIIWAFRSGLVKVEPLKGD